MRYVITILLFLLAGCADSKPPAVAPKPQPPCCPQPAIPTPAPSDIQPQPSHPHRGPGEPSSRPRF